MALAAVKVTLVPAHMLPLVTVMVGLAIAFTVKVAVLVQFPLAPKTVPVPIAAPFEVPIMVGPFKVFVVNPIIGPQV